ncbi:MAG: AMP-dependent synthetase/ligase [Nocardioidaceae bacterium]
MVHIADADTIIHNRASSVGQMFFDRVRESRNSEAYRYPVGEKWVSVTWGETAERVTALAAGLLALGIEPEQRVAIASSTRYEWILADLAIMSAGAATTTVYPTSVPDDVGYIVSDSDSQLIFAEDDEQIAKLRSRREEMPALAKVVTFDGTPDGDWVIGLSDLERLGLSLLAEDSTLVEQRVSSTVPENLATLIYTSGTTGRPKGVRLRHDSWTYEGVGVEALHLLSPDDLQYLWLPLAHAFGKVLLTAQLAIGFPTVVDGRVDKIIENVGVIRPTFMGAAPRIFEKAHGRIMTMAADEGGAKKRIFDAAFKVGKEVSRRQRAGERIPTHLAVQHAVFDRLVFAKIRARFGGRLRFFVSGAAALNRDVAEWFHAAGILIIEGYGLTESAAGTCVNRPDHFKLGTVGLPFEGTEMRIADDGELLISGPGVMAGYHNQDPDADVAVHDGWLHTGDIAEIDDDGFVRITDRKKDLFKTSGGKYVAPQIIEGQFKALCPYVSQIIVHGNQRNYCTAVITLDPEAIEGWAAGHGLGGSSYEQIVRSDQSREMVQGYVDQLNARLNRWESIKRFVLLDRDLSVEEGEITPSMKVKRKVVEDRYRDQLEALYS